MSGLERDLTAILDRAQMDGLAVVPIDVLRALVERGRYPALPHHEIYFPGPSPTWFMGHPAACRLKPCQHATLALRQFPPLDHAPGGYVMVLSDSGHPYLVTDSHAAKGNQQS